LGIQKGDRLFIHSSVVTLGRFSKVDDIIGAFLEAIDYEGIIVMPTYSCSIWPKARVFDPIKTKAETGNLPNEFLKLKGVRRSIQGNHSIAALGDQKDRIVHDWVSSSFSKESSIFKTIDQGFKNVMIGTKYSNGCSIFHCIEEELQVPYRYYKSFPGIVRLQDGSEREFDFKMFVRDLNYKCDFQQCASLIDNSNYVKEATYNYGKIRVFPLQDVYLLIKKALHNNPELFLVDKDATIS